MNNMEEATIELRDAIKASHEPATNTNQNDRNDEELLNNDVQAGGGSSEGTYISSLSGSLPSSERDRSNALASRRKNFYAAHNMAGAVDHEDNITNRHALQRRRLHLASRVENAVSNYELAVIHYHNDTMPSQANVLEPSEERCGNDDDDSYNQGDIVDLLVAVLTSVPRNLFQQADLGDKEVSNPQQEEEYLASMEQICFNAACISSDVIRKYFQNATAFNMENPPMLEDRHVYELIDEVVQICNTVPSIRASSTNIDPIVRILNSLSEGRQIERSMYEREQGNYDAGDDGYGTLFSCLSSKESLRLVHTLMYRYLCDHEDEMVEASSLVGYFISYLLEHFSRVVVADMGYDSFEECDAVGLLDAWADAADENMERRLHDEEARDVHALVVRYHIGSIQTALQLIENAELTIFDAHAETKNNDAIDDSTLQSVVITVKDTIRHMTMAVTTTEVMEKLSLEHDPEIHLIFHPLIISYTRFVVSFLHDAILLLRRAYESTHDGEEISILADDLLFRLCRVALGREFLKGGSADATDGEEEEVVAVSLLRAMNSQCITGTARFLLDIAAERVRSAVEEESMVPVSEPVPKRQRFGSTFGCGQLSTPHAMYKSEIPSPSDERRGEMLDVLIACLALSRSGHDGEDPDETTLKQTSCITSALMFCQEEASGNGNENEMAVIDPLNPWHTLQVKPVQRLADSSKVDDAKGAPRESLLSYSLLTPHLLDTKSS